MVNFYKSSFGKVLAAIILGVCVYAVVCGGVEDTQAVAAESDIYRENMELRELLKAFGTGPVDIYASVEDVRESKPAFTSVKMKRPVTVFGKIFFKATDNKGNVWLISPAQIGVVRASNSNYN
jgi:hypothetical protein